jgi:hypothetical protein
MSQMPTETAGDWNFDYFNPKGDLYEGVGAKPCHVRSVLFFGMYARNADSGRVTFPTLNLFASITKSTTLLTWMEKHTTTRRCRERLIITIGRKKGLMVQHKSSNTISHPGNSTRTSSGKKKGV